MINFHKRIQNGLVAAFAEVVNLAEEDINAEELWNWIKSVCKDGPPETSQGLCINATETNNKNDVDKLNGIQEHHNSPIAGNTGQAKTLELLKSNHQWQGMRRNMDRYIRNCHVCQSSKPRNQKTHRWLKPLKVPQQLWKDQSLDFVEG
jgi:hypothetical protein